MLRIIILGAAAGGGLPQWNCGCVSCEAARSPAGLVAVSTQCSLAATGDGVHWFLVNASPDLRQQLSQTSALHPRHGKVRDSPIVGVFLTNAEVDAMAGLLSLREGASFSLYAAPQALAVLKSNSVFDVLDRAYVKRISLQGEKTFIPTLDDAPVDFEVTPFAVEGKEPLYQKQSLPGRSQTLGLTLRDRVSQATVHIVTACAEITEDLGARLDGADAIFFDGTVWHDNELIAAGLGQKTGQEMGHVSMSGPEGAIALLASISAKRKIFVHINNSNPVWRRESEERITAERAGWEIGYDGMEIVL